jgi:DNA-binding transcriptional regulator LsrR (DeoR family)
VVSEVTRPKSRYRNMTPEKAREIRRAYFSREARQAELAARYGVRQNTISRIVSGLSWARA